MKAIIETLSAGFEAITRRLWILILPIALDLFLWRGPRVSLAPLVERWLAWINQLGALQPNSEAWLQMQELWTQMGIAQLWEQFAQRFNLFSILPSINIISLLSLGVLDVPSIVASNGVGEHALNVAPPVAEVSSMSALAGWALLLLTVGLLLAVLYHGLIAQEVREEQVNLRYLVRHLPAYWWYLARMALGVCMLLVVLGGPVLLVMFLVGAIAPGLMQILFLLASAAVFWLALYLSLIPHGILLGEEKPVVALFASMSLIHRNFGSALFLMLLIRLIRMGLGLVWPMMLSSSVGTLLAIGANAFVSAGLAAASFIFYRDRFALWREQLEASVAATAKQ